MCLCACVCVGVGEELQQRQTLPHPRPHPAIPLARLVAVPPSLPSSLARASSPLAPVHHPPLSSSGAKATGRGPGLPLLRPTLPQHPSPLGPPCPHAGCHPLRNKTETTTEKK